MNGAEKLGHIRRLTGYALRNKVIFIGFLLSSVIGVVFNLITPLVTIHIIDNIILADQMDQLLTYVLLYISLGALYSILTQ